MFENALHGHLFLRGSLCLFCILHVATLVLSGGNGWQVQSELLL